MGLPSITELQFFILSELMSGESAGHELRAALKKEGVRRSGPAFYQLMARLEEGKYVTGEYKSVEIAGQTVRERRYELTGAGKRAVADYGRFVARRLPNLGIEG